MFHSRHVDLAVRPLGGSHDFGAELELHALLLQDALEGLGHLHVDAHAADVAQKLDSCDLRSKTLPHGPLQDKHPGTVRSQGMMALQRSNDSMSQKI